MISVIGFARLLGWALPILLGCAITSALTAKAALVALECQIGQVAAAGRCVAVEQAAKRIDAIVRKAMTAHDLKAVLAGFAVDGDLPVAMAWGESMTGVPATPGMHFRNGSVAIAYVGTVLLQLRDKGVLASTTDYRSGFPIIPRPSRSPSRCSSMEPRATPTLSPILHSFSFCTAIRFGVGVRTN